MQAKTSVEKKASPVNDEPKQTEPILRLCLKTGQVNLALLRGLSGELGAITEERSISVTAPTPPGRSVVERRGAPRTSLTQLQRESLAPSTYPISI